MKKVAILAFTALIITVTLTISNAHAMSEPFMKVKLQNYLKNQSSITITTNSNYQIANNQSYLKASTIYTLKLQNGLLNLYNGTVLIHSYRDFTALSPKREALITIQNKVYRGSIEFTIEDQKYIRPINIVPLEDYVRGVIPQEISYTWHSEALKSQAVASRTYALSYSGKTINDTVSYQVYGGINYIPSVVHAVQATTGQALTYNGGYANATFSSSNGGYTESSLGAWGIYYPFLIAKKDSFDPVHPFSFAKSEQDLIANRSLMTKLEAQTDHQEIKEINDICLGNLTEGKRPKNLVFNVVTVGGALYHPTIQTDQFRMMMGSTLMKSTFIAPPVKKDGLFTFSGKGYGHGVGMSQYGAKKRADSGQNFKTIVSFYYPGAILTKEY